MPVLSGYFKLSENVNDQLNLLVEKFNLEYIVYTLGSKGSIIIKPGDYSLMEASKVKVPDRLEPEMLS